MNGQAQWAAGYRAGALKRRAEDCPFPPSSRGRQRWMEGYRTATEPHATRGVLRG